VRTPVERNTLIGETWDRAGPVEVSPQGRSFARRASRIARKPTTSSFGIFHRLPNGNVLAAIAKRRGGREVDPQGKVVWENRAAGATCSRPFGSRTEDARRVRDAERASSRFSPKARWSGSSATRDVPEVNLTWVTSLRC
jgi:hypothetical protein